MDLNRVTLLGRLAQDPELRTIPSGKTVASFSVATGRAWKDAEGQKQKQTEFHRLVAWGKLAEIVGHYLQKGRPVYVEGRLQTRDWTSDDGVKHYRTEIVADNVIMLGQKPAGAVSAASQSATSDDGEKPQEVIEEEVKVEVLPF